MGHERRPSRPPTSRQPQAGGGGSRKSSGRVPMRGSGRFVQPGAKKNNMPLIIGGAVGGFLVLVIIIAAASGTSARPAASNPKAPPPVDVSHFERDGLRKCDEGLALIQRSYDAGNKTGLQRGIMLIQEGSSLLEKANALSNRKYDTKRYHEALKMARMKVLELK